MSSYAKIWTTIFGNRDFLALPISARGLYLQLIVKSKTQRDDGLIYFRNITAMGQEMGCERRTCDNLMAKLQEKSLCTSSKDVDGIIEVILPNYKHWQEITAKDLNNRASKSTAKLPSHRPDKTIVDQTKSEKIIKDYPVKEPELFKQPPEPPKEDKPPSEYKFKVQAVIDDIKSKLDMTCTPKEAGMLLKIAGGKEYDQVGIVAFAINKASDFVDMKSGKFMGAVRKQLQERGHWSDEDWRIVKSKSRQFNAQFSKLYPDSLGKVIDNLR